MTIPIPPAIETWRSIGEALLIGLLVGAQRETQADAGENQAGLRDFILVALAGGICALLQSPWLTAAALLSIVALVGILHITAQKRTGITTEIAVVVTFCLGYLTAAPGYPMGAPLAIGVTIVVVAFLEAKRALHKLFRETITEHEFNDTLRFLAIVFVIHPVLPEGAFGPYQFFEPRKVWLFVILVSSISYLGYFLEKFLGARKGLDIASVLGGLASTTAATMAFSRSCADEPDQLTAYWKATVIANAIQFPRVLALLYAVNPGLAAAAWAPLLAMTIAGLALGLLISRLSKAGDGQHQMKLGNPFRLMPALKFGVIFTAIMFASKAAVAEFGQRALYWTGALGGALDADSVSVSVADAVRTGTAPAALGVSVVLLALFSNAIMKTLIALFTAGRSFGWRVLVGFLAMFAAGAVVLWI